MYDIFLILACFLPAAAIVGAAAGIVYLCVRHWEIGASVITVVLFFLAFIFIHP